MGKPFFYKVDAAEFMSAVFQIPSGTHEEWLRQLAIDLVAGVGNSEYSRKLIQDVEDYRRKQAESGSRGGKARSSKPKASLKRPLANLEQASSDPQANNNSSNNKPIKTQYAENVKMTEEEYRKLVTEHGQEKTDWMIQKLDNAKGSKGYKYKSDYRAILNWVTEEAVKNFKPQYTRDPMGGY